MMRGERGKPLAVQGVADATGQMPRIDTTQHGVTLTVTTAQPPSRVLQAPETLGLATREAFREAANTLLDQMVEGSGHLVIDLSGTSKVDSSGLGALVMVQRHASDRRQRVVLRGVGAELEYTLVLTKLDDLFLFAPAGG
jgi:anti-anti-sigma factor